LHEQTLFALRRKGKAWHFMNQPFPLRERGQKSGIEGKSLALHEQILSALRKGSLAFHEQKSCPAAQGKEKSGIS
jgi:hypothetical protein